MSAHLSIDGLIKLMQGHPDFVRMTTSFGKPHGEATVERWQDGELKQYTATFTLEDAKEFLAKSEVWRKYPDLMMRTRAIFAAAEKAFPEFFPNKPTIH